MITASPLFNNATPINTAPCPTTGGASARLPVSSASCGATSTWVGAKQVKNHFSLGPVATGINQGKQMTIRDNGRRYCQRQTTFDGWRVIH